MWTLSICAYSFLLILASTLVAGLSAYLFTLSVSACYRVLRTKNNHPSHQQQQAAHFLIVIPAHNEQGLIGRALEDLLSLNYPREKMETVVIADHCSDHTSRIAQQKGCAVLKRNNDGEPGKHRALNWAMEQHLRDWPRDYDAVAFIDANSHLSPDFLRHMSEKLQEGHQLLQSYDALTGEKQDWRSAVHEASVKLGNYLRPLGREGLGLPCVLRGNGSVISRELLEKFGYPAHSDVETIELALFYATKDEKVTFVPAASVYRKRRPNEPAGSPWQPNWHHNRIPVIKKWALYLLKRTLMKRDLSSLDNLIELLIPPFFPVISATYLLLMLALPGKAIIPGVLPDLALYLTLAATVGQTIYLATGLALTHTSPGVWKSALLAPAFMLGDAYRQIRDYITTSRATRD